MLSDTALYRRLHSGNVDQSELEFARRQAAVLGEEGAPLAQAFWDAFTSESASILVMEVVAIGVDRWMAAEATVDRPLCCSMIMTA